MSEYWIKNKLQKKSKSIFWCISSRQDLPLMLLEIWPLNSRQHTHIEQHYSLLSLPLGDFQFLHLQPQSLILLSIFISLSFSIICHLLGLELKTFFLLSTWLLQGSILMLAQLHKLIWWPALALRFPFSAFLPIGLSNSMTSLFTTFSASIPPTEIGESNATPEVREYVGEIVDLCFFPLVGPSTAGNNAQTKRMFSQAIGTWSSLCQTFNSSIKSIIINPLKIKET